MVPSQSGYTITKCSAAASRRWQSAIAGGGVSSAQSALLRIRGVQSGRLDQLDAVAGGAGRVRVGRRRGVAEIPARGVGMALDDQGVLAHGVRFRRLSPITGIVRRGRPERIDPRQ